MFSFNQNVPTTGHNPSADYGIMQSNNVSSAGIIAVDHLGYGTNGAGTHVKTTFNGLTTPPAPSGTGSVAYPNTGVAAPSLAEYYFQNSQATFLLSALKCFAQISPSAIAGVSPLVSPNSYNINVATSTQNYLLTPNRNITFTINLNNNVIFGTNACVLISTSSNNFLTSYTLASGVLTIVISGFALNPPTFLNFAILQA